MKIRRVEIKNYKSLRSVSLDCQDLVALVGENNSGKSNIIEALDLFFNPSSAKVTDESFYGKDTSKPIEVRVVFGELSKSEQDYFCNWFPGQEVIAKRVVNWGHPVQIATVGVFRVPEPEWLRETEVNGEKIDQWWKRVDQLEVRGIKFRAYLGSSKPQVKAWKEAISRFMAEHKNEIPLVEVEKEDPTGFANVLKGGLPKFIMVPAVRYVSEEMKVGKENPFGHLINTLFSGVPENNRAEIAESAKKVKQLMSRDHLPQIKEVEDLLKKQLCHFTECDIELEFPFPEVDDMLQGARIYVDDGIRTSVEAKGHGMQRSVIFGILRAYAELISKGTAATGDKKKSIVFAVEEPELYLHPQAQRTMMQALRDIARGEDQVVYTTHSSQFVDIAHFDEICLVRRERVDSHWATAINQVSMDALINDQKVRYPKTSPTPTSMRERYSHVYSATRSEGFFARRIILVEGQTEEYAIPTYSEALGYNLDKEGTSVISAGGKGQIERLLRVFNEFRIPCYVVFDGDKHTKEEDPKKQTMALLAFLGWQGSGLPQTTVGQRFTVFEDDFEDTIKSEVADYETIETEAKNILGLKEKSPLIARCVAKKLVERGIAEGEPSRHIPPTIKQIIESARILEWECSLLKCS